MTMRDPELRRTTTVRDRRSSNLGWLVGAMVVLLLLGALALSWDSTPNDTASNTGNAGSTASNTNATAPASTTGSAATTGSGSTAPASNVPPAGNTNR